MSETAELDRFALTYTEAEIWAFNKLVHERRDRGPAWDVWWSVVFAVIIGVGLMPYAALTFGLIRPVAFQPVLTTAYAAFIAGGLTYWGVAWLRTRTLSRAAARKTDNHWAFAFDDAGFTCLNEALETRVPWRAVGRVEDLGTMVVIWLGDVRGTCLPARVFTSAATRQDFVARTTARIKQARSA